MNRAGTPIYKSWQKAKGKKVLCHEWLNFEVFREWALSHGWRKGHTLQRHDLECPFSPENCYYRPPKEKEPRRLPDRRKTQLSFRGEEITLAELAKHPDCEVSYKYLAQRILRYGMEPELAIQKVLTPKNIKYTNINGWGGFFY